MSVTINSKKAFTYPSQRCYKAFLKLRAVPPCAFKETVWGWRRRACTSLEIWESQLGAFAAAAKSLLKQSPCQLVLMLRELVIPQRTEDNTGLLDVLPIRLLSGHPTEGFGLRQTVAFLDPSHGLVRRNKSSPHFMTHRLPASICGKRKTICKKLTHSCLSSLLFLKLYLFHNYRMTGSMIFSILRI